MATVAEAPISPRANGTSSPTAAKSGTAVSTGIDAPPTPASFHNLRHASTMDEGLYARWRPTSGEFSHRLSFDGDRRRSSIFSDYSLSEAKRNLQDDVINPGGKCSNHHENKYTLLPLIFALLPAIGGVVHKNGSAFMTDLMLLGLAAIFLNWSVTQPWSWYYAAQEIRVREEALVELGLQDDGDDLDDIPETTPRRSQGFEDVLEGPGASRNANIPDTGAQARRALDELYLHEVCALLMSFTAPLLAAVLLHWVRDRLSRPSEALISNYNLAIFVLAAEIVPLSHLIKLVQARTLHLQRIVHSNPYRAETGLATQMQGVLHRLDDLQSRMITVSQTATAAALGGSPAVSNDDTPESRNLAKHEAAVARSVRNSVQPEIDALNRAVRRYEKKATVLASLTESRLSAIDVRLNDAISLAAAAAKMNTSQWGLMAKLGAAVLDQVAWLLALPMHLVISLCLLPVRTLTGLLGERGRKQVGRISDDTRNGKRVREGLGRRTSGDRLPSRLTKR